MHKLTGTGISVLTPRGVVDQGTYVAKELVYAYALWISPAFHSKVIRAYDHALTAPIDPMAIFAAPARRWGSAG